jgi:TPR repeat protein
MSSASVKGSGAERTGPGLRRWLGYCHRSSRRRLVFAVAFGLSCHGGLGQASSNGPIDRPAPTSFAEASAWRSAEWILSCNQLHARRHPASGFVATLAELGPDRFGCVDERLARGYKDGYRFSYQAGVPDASGTRRAFTLCALPVTSPHRGRLAVVSDESGTIAARRSSGPPTPRECARAWVGAPSGPFALIKHCAIDYAEKLPDRGYPDALLAMGPQGTGCLAPDGDVTHVGFAFLRTRDRVYAYRGEAPRADGVIDRYSVYAHRRELSLGRSNPVQYGDESGFVRQGGSRLRPRDRPRLGSLGQRTPAESPEPAPEREVLERSCELGSAEDCHRAALLFTGTEPADVEQRARLLSQACNAGHGPACTELGHLLGAGRVGPDLRASGGAVVGAAHVDSAKRKDAMAARALRQAEYYEKGCGLGDAGGCLALAKRLDTASETLHAGSLVAAGRPTATTWLSVPNPLYPHRDQSRILELYEHACLAGLADGCVAASRAYEAAGDRVESARLWSEACKQGALVGCGQYGRRLLAGDGVAEDAASGLRLLEKVCYAAPEMGCSQLAEAYLAQRPPRTGPARELLDVLCEMYRQLEAQGDRFCDRRDQVGSP